MIRSMCFLKCSKINDTRSGIPTLWILSLLGGIKLLDCGNPCLFHILYLLHSKMKWNFDKRVAVYRQISEQMFLDELKCAIF
jgi:hypothetical protein